MKQMTNQRRGAGSAFTAGCAVFLGLSFSMVATAAMADFGGAQEGIASYYGGSLHGGPTASGERFNTYAMTAAHRTAKFGSRLKVTNLRNGRSVVVRINDRGPFVKGRIIDVSTVAAQHLGFAGHGITKVRVEPTDGPVAEVAAPAPTVAKAEAAPAVATPAKPAVAGAVAEAKPVPLKPAVARALEVAALPMVAGYAAEGEDFGLPKARASVATPVPRPTLALEGNQPLDLRNFVRTAAQ